MKSVGGNGQVLRRTWLNGRYRRWCDSLGMPQPLSVTVNVTHVRGAAHVVSESRRFASVKVPLR